MVSLLGDTGSRSSNRVPVQGEVSANQKALWLSPGEVSGGSSSHSECAAVRNVGLRMIYQKVFIQLNLLEIKISIPFLI
jgi:hypothetical protein